MRPAGYLCRSTVATPRMCIYARRLERWVWMTIYAVMKTGGKEYRVAPGDVVRVEKLAAAPGATVQIDEVCLIEIGQDVTVGSPTVADARVVAEVVEESRGEKIVTFKKKRRNHYQMTMDEVQSYTVLRIREIAVGKSVYAAAAPRRDVAAAATPPEPPPSAPIELPPPAPAQDDAPVALKVDTPPQAPQPTSDAVRPLHAVEAPPSAPSPTETLPARVARPPSVETAVPAPTLDERGPRKRSYGIAALVALLMIGVGLLVWGGRQPGPVEAATVAAPPQAAQRSVPQPAAKAPPRKETAIKRPAAASAPSAPVQPPE